MSAVLIHAAEIKNQIGKHSEAIALQQHALNILKDVETEHSEHYISELEYLKGYYHDAEETENEQQTESEMERLKHEIEYGYVPALTDFTTVEKCREHRVDAYFCCRYFLNHYLNADKMNEAATYILKWTMSTDDLTVNFGDAEARWLNDTTQVYMVAYLAGNNIYALENPEDCNSLAQYSNGIISMLNYYNHNKELTGEVSAFEEYLKLYAKKEKHLFDRIEKDYLQFEKSKTKGLGLSLTGDRQ